MVGAVEQDCDAEDHVAEGQDHVDAEVGHGVEDHVVEGRVAVDQDHVDYVDHFAIAEHHMGDLVDLEGQELEDLCMDPMVADHLDHCMGQDLDEH